MNSIGNLAPVGKESTLGPSQSNPEDINMVKQKNSTLWATETATRGGRDNQKSAQVICETFQSHVGTPGEMRKGEKRYE